LKNYFGQLEFLKMSDCDIVNFSFHFHAHEVDSYLLTLAKETNT